MLPDELFYPLDLEDALAEADEIGGDAVIDLLVAALTDPRARGDDAVEEYLDTLIDAYRDAGRQRDAIKTLRREGDLEPSLAGALAADIAGLHADLGERDIAVEMLTRRYDDERARPATERDLNFFQTAAWVAQRIGDRELAGSLVTDGLSLAVERDNKLAVVLLEELRGRVDPEQGSRLQQAIARILRDNPE